MNRATLKEIIKFLGHAYISEDMHDHTDGDGEGWGPALGAAVNNAKVHNKKLEKLIAKLKMKLKETK